MELTPFILPRNLLDKKSPTGIRSHGLKGSASFLENCDFRSQFDPLKMFWAFFLILFVGVYILNEKVQTNPLIKRLLPLISNRRNRMLLTLVSPGWIGEEDILHYLSSPGWIGEEEGILHYLSSFVGHPVQKLIIRIIP